MKGLNNFLSNEKFKKVRKVVFVLLGLSIYLLGGVQFMSYVVISIMFFAFGSLYRKIKVEYEDYKMLKLVQKSMIKLDDYKLLQDENIVLKEKINSLQSTLSNVSSGMTGGVTGGYPPVYTREQQQPNNLSSNLSNLDMLREVTQND